MRKLDEKNPRSESVLNTYGIVAWGNSADQGIKRISSLQKLSVRYISNARNKAHTSNLFAEYEIS